jgi:anti-sigma factor RsiW
MNCQRVQDLLESLLDGRLQGEVLRQVRKHIISCPACRSGLSARNMMEILPVLDESIEPSEDFSTRFYAALDGRHRAEPEKQPQPAGLKSMRILTWSKGLVAAGVLAVLVAAGIYFRQSPSRIPDTSAVFYELEVTENLAFFEDMELIENLEFFEDLDTIEHLPQTY